MECSNRIRRFRMVSMLMNDLSRMQSNSFWNDSIRLQFTPNSNRKPVEIEAIQLLRQLAELQEAAEFRRDAMKRRAQWKQLDVDHLQRHYDEWKTNKIHGNARWRRMKRPVRSIEEPAPILLGRNAVVFWPILREAWRTHIHIGISPDSTFPRLLVTANPRESTFPF